GEVGEQLRDLAGDPGAYEDVVDPRDHGAEGGRRGGHLDLLEVVDPDDAVVALLGEPDVGEVAEHRQLDRPAAGRDRQCRVGAVGGGGAAAPLDEVAGERALDHL